MRRLHLLTFTTRPTTMTHRGKLAARLRTATLFMLTLLMVMFSANLTLRVFAAECPANMSKLDCDSIWGNWTDWVPDNLTNCTANSGGTAGAVTVPPGQNSGAWNSGLTPPYILEQFMIETLKDIARKRGVPESDTVTQQHVIALIAFAWGEGGGLTNDDFWNPFNTGIDAPDLTAGGVHVTNGVQAFKSFDAGVEATARVMTGSTQGRLGVTLSNPDSTALDFLTSWLDFPPKAPYPTGHYPWAEASDPSSKYFQPDYQQKHVDLINQVTKNYDSMASTIMRGQPPDPSDKHDTSKLHFHTTGGATGASPASSCACAPTNNNVVALDPGHSGNSITSTDAATGLKDYDYPNHPEMEDVFDVANLVRTKLTADGYKVVMTKNAAGDSVSLRQRADIANSAHASIAVSIHDQAGPGGSGLPFASANNIVYDQGDPAHAQPGDSNALYRQKPDGSKVYFTNNAVAKTSQAYANNFVTSRGTAEGHSITLKENAGSDIGDRGLAPGNIWMVQLFSNVPWVYNEAGGNSAGQVGLNSADKTKYANGIIAGIERSLPLNVASATGCSGTFFETAKSYAWPSYKSAPYCVMRQTYADAVQAALDRMRNGKNDYVGGGSSSLPPVVSKADTPPDGSDCSGGHAGIDCGGFVTRVFRDSGADPNYNQNDSNVVGQYIYVSTHPNLYKRVSAQKNTDLQPGDIFFASDLGHTYIFVGDKGYPNYNAVSASFSTTGGSWRTPMASPAYDIGSSTWYRPLFPLNSATSTAAGTGTNAPGAN